jgi:adenylate cyclase, class 2
MTAVRQEVEIKFRLGEIGALEARLAGLGFRLLTERTHEENMLFDLPGFPLRRREAILRIRRYGHKWTLTYKDKKRSGRRGRSSAHKVRREMETEVADGRALAGILEALGFRPVFTYEKFRSEWTDGAGHVVIDQTPVGNFAEIEGQPIWIDKTASSLGINSDEYITASYLEVFLAWKKKTRSPAKQMTFTACK